MKTGQLSLGRAVAIVGAVLALLLSFAPPPASADTFSYTLSVPNTAISSDTGPYATVTVNRSSSTTATVTFNSLTNGGFIYLMGDGSSAGVNVNASSFSLTGVSGTNSLGLGFTPGPFTVANPPGTSNVDGFGLFNGVVNSFDGFTHTSTQISFTLTDLSGTWASAAAVLAANAKGALAEVHVFACANSPFPCTSITGATNTGYAANGGATVPEPSTLTLLGPGLVGVGVLLRKRLFKRGLREAV